TIKANGVALGALALLGTSSMLTLAAAARSLGLSEKFTAMFLLMLRYFTVIYQEYQRLRTAMSFRGFKSALNMHSLRTYAALVGLLLVRSLDRADRVYAAMLCRGYEGRFYFAQNFKFSKIDLILLNLIIFILFVAFIF
ncbi:MAG: energy-coupling factor transporter transmembrane component T family protein, partial [Candidatus Adiutrix sp.]